VGNHVAGDGKADLGEFMRIGRLGRRGAATVRAHEQGSADGSQQYNGGTGPLQVAPQDSTYFEIQISLV
jgi:hypothetical protein